MAYSISAIKDFDGCPLRYKLKHLDGLPESSTSIAIVGQIVADLMAEIRIAYYSLQRETEPEERRGVAYKSAVEHNGTDEEAENALAIVEKAYAEMDGLFPPFADVIYSLVEKGIAFDKDFKRIPDLPDTDYYTDTWGHAHFKCKPDFIWLDAEGLLHVEDDKSGWNEADTKQLVAYAWCVRTAMIQAGRPEPVGVILHFNYLAMNKRVLVDPSELDAFPGWLAAKTAEIEGTRDFAPQLGKSCDWCGFVARCSLHDKTRDQIAPIDPETLRAITSLDQAERGGLWLMAAKRLVAASEVVLRAWVEANGSVPLADTGLVLGLRGGEPVRHATAGDVLEAVMGSGITKADFYGRVKLSTKDVDDVLAGDYPLGGKGVDKSVKAHNKAQRMAVYEALAPSWVEAKRSKRLEIFKPKEE